MKKLLLTIGILSMGASALFAQKYMTRTGKATFDATTSTSPEKIAGKNNEVAGLLNAGTGEIVFQMQIKAFKFEKQLMEEHFNEKYLESDKYTKSDFKGKINNLAEINFSKDGNYKTTVTGKMTMHGNTADMTIPGTITVEGKKVKLSAKFKVKLADHKIVVPALVGDKVAQEAEVTFDAEMTQQ